MDQLSDWLGIKWRLFTDQEKYLATPCNARINYGTPANEIEELCLVDSNFLAGNDSAFQDVLVSKVARFLEKQDKPALQHIDYFSIIFSCLSRYEEYQTTQRDVHGRFAASQSHAFQHGYLQRPVVNELLLELTARIQAVFPDCKLALPTPSLQLTYDVDVPYAYRLRGWRGIASGCKDLLTGHLQRSLQRFRLLLGSRSVRDPYNTYDWLERLHRRHGLSARYFWLLTKERSTYDPNPAPDHPSIIALIQRSSETAKIGIHPSYYSSNQPALFSEERDRLRQITGQPVEHSRQHFLRFNLPDTYRQLLKAGLRHDHSMGYADAIGYRAGTNLPFYWYDLEREEKTWLRIYPFVAMDVSLKKYQKLGYFASQQLLLQLADDVLQTGGPFTLLWHNSSFASEFGWEGWAEMYADLVGELSERFQK